MPRISWGRMGKRPPGCDRADIAVPRGNPLAGGEVAPKGAHRAKSGAPRSDTGLRTASLPRGPRAGRLALRSGLETPRLGAPGHGRLEGSRPTALASSDPMG